MFTLCVCVCVCASERERETFDRCTYKIFTTIYVTWLLRPLTISFVIHSIGVHAYALSQLSRRSHQHEFVLYISHLCIATTLFHWQAFCPSDRKIHLKEFVPVFFFFWSNSLHWIGDSVQLIYKILPIHLSPGLLNQNVWDGNTYQFWTSSFMVKLLNQNISN